MTSRMKSFFREGGKGKKGGEKTRRGDAGTSPSPDFLTTRKQNKRWETRGGKAGRGGSLPQREEPEETSSRGTNST